MEKEERKQAVAQKTKDLATRILLQTGVISGSLEELPVPAQIVTPQIYAVLSFRRICTSRSLNTVTSVLFDVLVVLMTKHPSIMESLLCMTGIWTHNIDALPHQSLSFMYSARELSATFALYTFFASLATGPHQDDIMIRSMKSINIITIVSGRVASAK